LKGRYPVAGVNGQGVVGAVDRNTLVELVLNDVADADISDVESRSPGRSTSMNAMIVSPTCTHEIRIEKHANSIQRR